MKNYIQSLVKARSRDEDAGRREFILNVILLCSILLSGLCDILIGYYNIERHPGVMSFWAFSIVPAFFVLLYMVHGLFILLGRMTRSSRPQILRSTAI